MMTAAMLNYIENEYEYNDLVSFTGVNIITNSHTHEYLILDQLFNSFASEGTMLIIKFNVW